MHDRISRAVSPGGQTATHSFIATSGIRDDGDQVVVARGSIEGLALAEFGTALDLAVAAHTPCVYVDLAGVTHWSLLAQAMVLTTARDLTRHGRRLVLQSPSAALREEDGALHVFARVSTDPAPFP